MAGFSQHLSVPHCLRSLKPYLQALAACAQTATQLCRAGAVPGGDSHARDGLFRTRCYSQRMCRMLGRAALPRWSFTALLASLEVHFIILR